MRTEEQLANSTYGVGAITPDRIEATARRIAGYIRRTPTVELNPSDVGLPGLPWTVKLELLQHSGSFKTRGAFANLCLREVPHSGVVAASGGNHGAAVAYAARQLGVPATIFVPSITSPAKVDLIRQYGGKLVITGERYADALAASEVHVADTGALPVHAFDQIETLLGQGTLGRELEQQAPNIDTLVVAVGGGGLIGGMRRGMLVGSRSCRSSLTVRRRSRLHSRQVDQSTPQRVGLRPIVSPRDGWVSTFSLWRKPMSPRTWCLSPMVRFARRKRRCGLLFV